MTEERWSSTEERWSLTLTVDGRRFSSMVRPRQLLSDFLRDEAGALGVHIGCGQGICGACTVVLDGAAVRACLMLAIQAEGSCVQTVVSLPEIEGGPLSSVDQLTRLQAAFREHHALQCGFCTPGLLVSTAVFLARVRTPSREAIVQHLNGHLCRCTGYANIIAAIESVAAMDVL